MAHLTENKTFHPSFYEVWLDINQHPPYVLLLFGGDSSHFQIINPQEQGAVEGTSTDYQDLRYSLNEDEFTPLQTARINSEDDADEWEYAEVWLNPEGFPAQVLVLLANKLGNFHIYNPAKGQTVIQTSTTYHAARHWLGEQGYQQIQGQYSLVRENV